MRPRSLPACLLIVPALALAACGDDSPKIDTAAYTCGDFNKSLRTKGDDSAGTFINKLREQAGLGLQEKVERRFITLGIYFACRDEPGSTRPASKALAAAKQMKAGKFKLPAPPADDEKSGK